MKTRMAFNVYGSSRAEIERRAYGLVADYLSIDNDPEFVAAVADLEIDVTVSNNLDELKDGILVSFVGHVSVKLKG